MTELDGKYAHGKVGNMDRLNPSHEKLRALHHQWRDASAHVQQEQRVLTQVRAMICAMNHDVITAGLWALAGFDPALVHLAELRERFANLPEDDQIRITLDRLTSVYVEGQCHELLRAAGITTCELTRQIHHLEGVGETTLKIVDCTSDPLALETAGYAMRLGTLTAHGQAPWKRFAAVMADCHAQLVS